MQATTAHHAHQQPMRGWRHSLAHAQARVTDLRQRTTMGPLGPVDDRDWIGSDRRDHPYRTDR